MGFTALDEMAALVEVVVEEEVEEAVALDLALLGFAEMAEDCCTMGFFFCLVDEAAAAATIGVLTFFFFFFSVFFFFRFPLGAFFASEERCVERTVGWRLWFEASCLTSPEAEMVFLRVDCLWSAAADSLSSPALSSRQEQHQP